jgi:diguanylate cyclase (GGDEF)-like protein
MGEQYEGPDRRSVPRLGGNEVHKEHWMGEYGRLYELVKNGELSREEFVKLLWRQREGLEELAGVDALTGLKNRRSLENDMETLVKIARKQDLELAVVMVDIDEFKKLNDTCGHPAGDKVLRTLGAELAKMTSEDDLVTIYRYGGEEMTIVILGMSEEELKMVVRSVGRGVAGNVTRVVREGVEQLPEVTFSMGVAMMREDDDGAQLIDRADKLQYKAKRSDEDGSAGRNRAFVESKVMGGEPEQIRMGKV